MFAQINLKTIDGEEKAFKFLATASTAYRYRQVFNEDLMLQLNKLRVGADGGITAGDFTIVNNLAFIMNAQAEGKDTKKLNFELLLEWCDQFSAMELMTHAPEIINLYLGNKETHSTPKKE
ncbi:MAG: hypothetical protein IJU07_06620 [Synergistaceae bacterium]|nr:hypothetical protein [Synergistaceae bacterium]